MHTIKIEDINRKTCQPVPEVAALSPKAIPFRQLKNGEDLVFKFIFLVPFPMPMVWTHLYQFPHHINHDP